MKLKSVIICDDIREEIGGKLTLVGVYSGSLLLDRSTTFPALVKSLCLVVSVSIEAGDPLPEKINLRMVFNGEQVLEHTGIINAVNRAEPVTVRLAFVPFTLRGFGEVTFEVAFSSGVTTLYSFTEKMTIAQIPA